MQNRITKKGFEQLVNKKKELILEQEELIKIKAAAGELKDLRENSEYQEAVESLSQLGIHLNKLNAFISSAIIIEKIEPKEYVDFGAIVHLENITNQTKHSYQIVGDYESDISKGLISEDSVLAQLLMHKKIDTIVQHRAGTTIKEYKICDIQYNV